MIVFMSVIFFLAILYLATSIAAFIMIGNSRDSRLPKPFSYPVLLIAGGFSVIVCIFCTMFLYLELNRLRESIKNPNQYEVVNEIFYKKVN